MSLLALLRAELRLPGARAPRADSELLANITKVPLRLERFIAFGTAVCLNSFLTLFTLVPLRIALLLLQGLRDAGRSRSLRPLAARLQYAKHDVCTVVLVAATAGLLMPLETSRLYHDIRGLAHIKLYVIFGVLEAADRLLSSVGHDVALVFAGVPVCTASAGNWLRLAVFFGLALAYTASHAYVLIYQCVALHVAANLYSNALMALLLLNQFAELKGSVFKKFDREGLFQLAMADLTERVQLSLMLVVIALRNISQISGTPLGLVPRSWLLRWLGAVLGPCVVVLGSEVSVDWLKHCFIGKFNRIRPGVYDRFLYVHSLDFLESANDDELGYLVVTRRVGVPLVALAVCFLRMILDDVWRVFCLLGPVASAVLVAVMFAACVVLRLLLGVRIRRWAEAIRQRETETKSYGPGVPNTHSSLINPSTREKLYEAGEQVPPTSEERRVALGEALGSVHRYSMSSKRIW